MATIYCPECGKPKRWWQSGAYHGFGVQNSVAQHPGEEYWQWNIRAKATHWKCSEDYFETLARKRYRTEVYGRPPQ